MYAGAQHVQHLYIELQNKDGMWRARDEAMFPRLRRSS